MSTPADPPITLTVNPVITLSLPLSDWHIVLDFLFRAPFVRLCQGRQARLP